MELRDGELTLRPLQDGDLSNVVAACSDPEIARFTLLVPSPYTDADGRAFVAHCSAAWAAEAPERTFAIVVGGGLQGVVAVDLESGVVGYWMRREARGRGWMTRAVRLVVAWGRAQGVEQFSLTTHPENAASQRVAEKAGFQQAGTVEEPRGFRDGTTRAVAFELGTEAL
jgi:RimJ/RimL family protein N-acetyltransferase